MKKIKILFTGGTIGSLIDGTNINTDQKSQHLLLNLYKERYKNESINFTTDAPLNILSENLNQKHWLDMINAINTAIEEGYEGIVLTHGSDTLAYSSAFLNYVFSSVKIPIVLVASHKPLSEPDTNGVDNFAAAITLINNHNKGGVFVSYRNPSQDYVKIHLGSRMEEPAPFSDNFESGNNKVFAVVKNNQIKFLNSEIEKQKTTWNYDFKLKAKQVFIRPHPGLDYSLYMNPNNKPDFILHDMFHSGTANIENIVSTNGKQSVTSLIEFAKYCKENDIDLYVCNIKNREVHYDSTNQLIKHGVTPLYDIVANSALAKLMVAYNFLEKDNIKDYINSNVCGEIVHTKEENEYRKEEEHTLEMHKYK